MKNNSHCARINQFNKKCNQLVIYNLLHNLRTSQKESIFTKQIKIFTLFFNNRLRKLSSEISLVHIKP
jgi:hypothetical protein